MYYIYENQIKKDGGINALDTVVRSTFASGISYFHERVSKMAVADFESVSILITDVNHNPVENGHAYIHDGIVTLS